MVAILPDPEIAVYVERCAYGVAADWDGDMWAIERCGKPAVDDEDEPRCAEHLDQ